ncbi:MAG: calcium-binding protein, partial [bacterium]
MRRNGNALAATAALALAIAILSGGCLTAPSDDNFADERSAIVSGSDECPTRQWLIGAAGDETGELRRNFAVCCIGGVGDEAATLLFETGLVLSLETSPFADGIQTADEKIICDGGANGDVTVNPIPQWFSGILHIDGGDGDDQIEISLPEMSGVRTTLVGGLGNDVLRLNSPTAGGRFLLGAREGSDIAIGGDGPDLFDQDPEWFPIPGETFVECHGNGGSDRFEFADPKFFWMSAVAIIFGGSGDDIAHLGWEDDFFSGQDGEDTVYGGFGFDACAAEHEFGCEGWIETVHCGNGVCEGLIGETVESCPDDCVPSGPCGDGVCGEGERCASCPSDCGPCVCGDGVCTADESQYSCPADCPPPCGDHICEAGETFISCPADCPDDSPVPMCGNEMCEEGEDSWWCPTDCSAGCGDGACGADESCISCPADCDECPDPCGDGICAEADGETHLTCPDDCPNPCGDGVCEGLLGETVESCPADCEPAGPVCGDGVCDALGGETILSCPADCEPAGPVCGDGGCTDDESCISCPADCGACPAEIPTIFLVPAGSCPSGEMILGLLHDDVENRLAVCCHEADGAWTAIGANPLSAWTVFIIRGSDANDTIEFVGGADLPVECSGRTVGGSSPGWLGDLEVYGGGGLDTIDMDGLNIGACHLEGEADADTIVGCSCATSMDGGEGDDVLTGRSWSDACNGGGGTD